MIEGIEGGSGVSGMGFDIFIVWGDFGDALRVW